MSSLNRLFLYISQKIWLIPSFLDCYSFPLWNGGESLRSVRSPKGLEVDFLRRACLSSQNWHGASSSALFYCSSGRSQLYEGCGKVAPRAAFAHATDQRSRGRNRRAPACS